MAVVQISQIQIRRGLLQDLGQLAAGELGWATDRLRLFIGNGTIEEGAPYLGNTEILTNNSDLLEQLGNYWYRGLLGGYRVNTGLDSLNPTLRTFQNKVDDIVNIRDFGAAGDGFNDDTDAIQRAINEIYGRRSAFTPVIARRTIYFHPGVYRITQPILLPPYTTLKNSGKDSVILQQEGVTANCVVRATTATGAWENLPSNSVLGPIEISGINLQTNVSGIPVAVLDSVKDVSFYRCRFIGSEQDNSPTTDNGSRSVVISSTYNQTKSIYFTECDFAKSAVNFDIEINTQTTDISIDRCTFANTWQSVSASGNVSNATSLRVTNSIFTNVSRQAIKTTANVSGVVTAFNTFVNVGNGYQGSGNPVTPVIEFGGNLSYSFADIMTRPAVDSVLVPTVVHQSPLAVSTDATSHFRYGNTFQTIGKTIIFENSSENFIPLPAAAKTAQIEYSAERGSNSRSGAIKYAIKNQQIQFHESYTENDQVGVDLSIIYDTTPYIRCVADGSGASTALTYDIKFLR